MALLELELSAGEQLFIEGISSTPLLTGEEEHTLALKIRAGGLVQEVTDALVKGSLLPTPVNLIRGLAHVFDTPVAQAWYETTNLPDLIWADETFLSLGQEWSNVEKPSAANNPYLYAATKVAALFKKEGVKQREVERVSLNIGAAGNILKGLPQQQEDWGNYFQSIKQEGEAARLRFISANCLLVLKQAGKQQRNGLNRLELFQEGYWGLDRAVRGFNPYLGGKFSSYAQRAIQQDIQRGKWRLNAGVHVPTSYLELLREFTVAINTLAVSLGREPTDEEIRGAMAITADNLAGLRLAQVVRVTSLSKPVHEDGGELEEVIPYQGKGTDELALENLRVRAEAIKALVEEMLGELPPEYREVLRRHAGIGSPEMNNERIGQDLGYSRETARKRLKGGMEALVALAQNGYRERIMEALEEV